MTRINLRRAETYTTCRIEIRVGTDQLGQDVYRFCLEPAHVVLFADQPGEFAGRRYGHGDRILACLEHGGQIYDALHDGPGNPDRPHGFAAWLRGYAEAGRLPVPHLPEHAANAAQYAPPRRWGDRQPHRERRSRAEMDAVRTPPPAQPPHRPAHARERRRFERP